MADDKYYTTDTKCVTRDIDVSSVASGGDDDEVADERTFEWKQPLGYLLLVVLVVLAVLFASQSFASVPSLLP